MGRQINACQDNGLLELGRIVSEDTYSRKKKEVEIGNIKIDLIDQKDGKLVLGEVKKSSRFLESARMQLAYYLYRLKEQGVKASGELLVPKEKKKVKVVLDEKLEDELKQAILKIESIIETDKPPELEKNRFCTKCAYREFCWA